MDTHVLLVEDDRDTAQLLREALVADGHRVTMCHEVGDALTNLEECGPDAVLTDLALGDESGLEICRYVADQHPDLPVVVVTAHASLDVAIEALRAGAFDLLTKPVDLTNLRHQLHRAMTHHELRLEVRRLRRVSSQTPAFPEIIGESPAMQRVFSRIARLGESDTNVLITGESGVGKELVARALHEHGFHGEGPFVALNCAAVPASLIESELFGHVRGAFTDAKSDRDGVFVRANRGTLFLDEIGELPAELQPKLLRVLQERKVTPVGGDREIAFDARILTATNRDLVEQVEAGAFRQDLFYRLNVVEVHVPPLRARTRDIRPLCEHFLREIAARLDAPPKRIASPAMASLLAYDWPGNVRELENAMERAVALSRGDEITLDDLPARIRDHRPHDTVVVGTDPEDLPTLEELENDYICRVVESVKGNRTQAANILGIGRRTLYRRLDRIRDDANDDPDDAAADNRGA